MHIFKELFFIILVVFIRDGESLGISSKLDFGSASSSPGVRPTISGAQYKLSKTPSDYKTVIIEDSKDDFDKIGVVCVSGIGCNTTKSVDNNSDAEIKTDVHVHVQTKVDLKTKNKTILDDTPDIPVVVGLKGTNFDHSSTGIASSLHSDSYLNTDSMYGISDGFAIDRVGLDDFSGTLDLGPSGVFVPPSNIDSNPILLTPEINAESKLDSEFENAPTLRVELTPGSDVKNIKYKNRINEMEVNIPYFESAFHKQYYGEQPPQHLVWYPKRGGSYNPVEFKNFAKPNWKPFIPDSRSFNTNYNTNYNLRPNYHKHTDTPGIRTEVCTCKTHNGQHSDHNGQSISRHSGSGDPGSQINDKLAPLN